MQSTFGEKLNSNKFIITAEITPPKGVDASAALADAKILKGLVDALNITDNQRAIMRMSPLALGKLLLERGYEVIMQMTCRDRNRLSIQSDILGAAALGIGNICLMSGDHTTNGDHPGAKPVYDLDSVQLLSMVQKMQNGFDISGNELEGVPELVVGAVSNTDPSQVMQMMKLEKKVRMGARFIQTQAVYDVGQFEEFTGSVSHLDIPIIAGLIPLKSANAARFMNENIPGINVDDEIIARMESAGNPVQEGLMICSETIGMLKKTCRGIHLMPIGQHLNTPKLLEMAGLPVRR
ncbi:MAG TPA: methylenetetrahydrofolate reductase [Methanosarcinaceae archaeon]|nr:methylenetetrahydrofolate reductase [Methanosarcinaceae archaeon]